MKIVTAQEMRHIEDECAGLGLTSAVLMENAGRAAAQQILRLFGPLNGKRAVVLAGPGNNGGDGLVAARHLAGMGASVCLYLGEPRPNDPNLIQA
jgi:ADP-dependent NAD(P)H-hydrate dehydratase / NAD(P)H-hydrate epimerase